MPPDWTRLATAPAFPLAEALLVLSLAALPPRLVLLEPDPESRESKPVVEAAEPEAVPERLASPERDDVAEALGRVFAASLLEERRLRVRLC